jgi:hypothetical protein
VLELEAGAGVEGDGAVDDGVDGVCDSVAGVAPVAPEVAVDGEAAVIADVAAPAVEPFECPDADAAKPPIRTVAPMAADPVATVSFLTRLRLKSRLCADGSRLLIPAFEQPFLNAS